MVGREGKGMRRIDVITKYRMDTNLIEITVMKIAWDGRKFNINTTVVCV